MVAAGNVAVLHFSEFEPAELQVIGKPVPDYASDLDIERDPDRDVVGERQTPRYGQRQGRACLIGTIKSFGVIFK